MCAAFVSLSAASFRRVLLPRRPSRGIPLREVSFPELDSVEGAPPEERCSVFFGLLENRVSIGSVLIFSGSLFGEGPAGFGALSVPFVSWLKSSFRNSKPLAASAFVYAGARRVPGGTEVLRVPRLLWLRLLAGEWLSFRELPEDVPVVCHVVCPVVLFCVFVCAFVCVCVLWLL